jgi:murein DD-endopeptidase MepM/ murein hydrolase activator NlpD
MNSARAVDLLNRHFVNLISWNRTRVTKTILIMILVIVLPACQSTRSTQIAEEGISDAVSYRATQDQVTHSDPVQPSQLPTSVIFSEAGSSLSSKESNTAIATPAPDPLRFVFPTPVQAPVSAWRPPLYPTPWAPTPFDHFFFSRPIAADEINWPVATYRYGGEFFADTVHTGVDIPAPKGTPVIAAGSGKIIWAGYGVYRGGYDTTDPYGLAVTIRHDFGYQNQPLYTIYGHLDQIEVAEGQYVETGELLGFVGETGNVTGPHLHFELRVNENNFFSTRNPELWIAPPQGWGVIAGRVMDSNGKLINDQLIIVTNPSAGQNWFARSYGPEAVNSDPYYSENLVIGDLPAGTYQLRTSYAGYHHSSDIEVHPGLVTFFSFRGWGSFSIELPPTPGAEYTPIPIEDKTASNP